ncbi:MAG: hypothetical protein QM734_06020 [Cyclobacteriaceae bacterium]
MQYYHDGNGFFNEAHNDDSCPASSIIHLNFPRKDGKGNILLTWMDGGLLPKRPDELLPGEPMGDWDGGIIFEGTKGKLMAGCYGRNPTLLPTSRMKEAKMPAPKLARVPGGPDGHYTEWVNVCKKGYEYRNELSSPFDYSGPFTEAVLMGNLALRSYVIQQPNANGKGNHTLEERN